jgi:hypothetical protein
LGAVVLFFAAFAIGRMSVVAARDVLAAERGGRWFGRRAAGTSTAGGETAAVERPIPSQRRAAPSREPVRAGGAGNAAGDRPDTTA